MCCQLMFILKGVTYADHFRMGTSPQKREYLSMKILPELIAALDRLSAEENRSRSNTAEQVLLKWFREHRLDLLSPPNPEETNDQFRKALGLDDQKP